MSVKPAINSMSDHNQPYAPSVPNPSVPNPSVPNPSVPTYLSTSK
jgi:hypothetical protein